MFGFKLTKKKVMGITYKEKLFLEFQVHCGQAPHTKTELRLLKSFSRIGDLTYSYFPNRYSTDASLFMDSNTNSLLLNHLAMVHTSHLVLAIQGDP